MSPQTTDWKGNDYGRRERDKRDLNKSLLQKPQQPGEASQEHGFKRLEVFGCS